MLALWQLSSLDFGSTTPTGPLPSQVHLCTTRGLSKSPTYACRRIFMSAIALLIDSVKAVASSARVIADTLETAVNRASAVPFAALSEEEIQEWDLELLQDEASSSTRTRPAPTTGSDYNSIARALPALPVLCLDICGRLGGTQEEVRARAQRAWDAGCWAKAVLEGKIPKPRPTPKIPQKAACYIILRAPGLAHPVRVDSAAE